MKKLSTLFLLFLTASIGYGQITVSGVIKDSQSLIVLPGVTVNVKGKNLTTQTDVTGQFTIEAAPTDELEFSFIGYTPQTITIGDQTTIDVFLDDESRALDEVVVIGYGTARKRDLTGSIETVKGSVVADKPNANPIASIQGKVAGVQIVNSGRPGQEPDIRIRGTNSINGFKPLYVVDGVLNDNINFLNPADIESMEILKDPSSLAIFGVRGANGVIIVTTKTAKAGQLNFNFNSTIGFKSVTDRMKLTDAAGFKMLYDEQLANQGNPAFNYANYNADTDWQDEIFQNGILNYNNLSVSGATEKNKFYMGLGYMIDEGIIKNEKLNKITLTLNDQLSITDNFRVGINFSGYHSKLPQNDAFYNPIVASAVRAAPISPARDDASNLYYQLPDFQRAQIRNPLVSVNDLYDNAILDEYRAVGNTFAEVDFLKNFTFRGSFLFDYGFNQGRTYEPLIRMYNPDITGTDKTDLITTTTAVSQYQNVHKKIQTDWLLTYKNTFGDHDLTATAGWTSYYLRFEDVTSRRTQGNGDPIPDDPRFWYTNIGATSAMQGGGSAWDNATLSLLARAIYSYKGKYLLNGSFRRDGNSAFHKYGNEWQNFGAIGAGWVISEEDFLQDQSFINNLKIKGSWGVLGIQNTADYRYPLYPLLTAQNSAVFGDDIYPALEPSYIPDRNLTWERVTSWEAGFELAALSNRLTLNAVYYDKHTDGIIVLRPGLLGTKPGLSNAGEVRNNGLELSSSWSQPLGEELLLNISGNLTTMNNKVISLVEEGYQITDGISRTTTGYPIGYFYGYKMEGIYQNAAEITASPTNTLNTVRPGDIKYVDVNGDGEITTADRTLIGNPTPDFTYGFTLNLAYKNLDISTDFMGVVGNDIFRNWNRGSFTQFNFLEDQLGRWYDEGTSNTEPIIDRTRDNNRLVSDYWIEKGTFFRLRNLQIGYNFPTDMLQNARIKSLRVFLNAQNVFTAKQTTGYTPEIGGSATSFGLDNGTYPVPSIYTFGVNLNF